MRYRAVLLIVVIISTVCSATEDTVKLVKNIKPAVVLIQTCGTAALGCDFRGMGILPMIVLSVIPAEAGIQSYSGRGNPSRLPSSDPNIDPNGRGDRRSPSSDPNFPFLKLSKQIPSEGEDIVVVGNPLGLESSVSTGIVSAVRKIPAFGKIIQIT